MLGLVAPVLVVQEFSAESRLNLLRCKCKSCACAKKMSGTEGRFLCAVFDSFCKKIHVSGAFS
jgi:hypothetical protein